MSRCRLQNRTLAFLGCFQATNNLCFEKNSTFFLRKDCDGVASTEQGTVLRSCAAMLAAPRVPAVLRGTHRDTEKGEKVLRGNQLMYKAWITC